MSNILIIKHGSLGDLIQANGAIKDIKEFYSNRKVFLLTSRPYSLFMSECPYIDGVIIDKRLNELTPEHIKIIMKEMIQKHLGWLVVWGGVFGFLIGLLLGILGSLN